MTTPRKRTPRIGVAGAMEIAKTTKPGDLEYMRAITKGEIGVQNIEQALEASKANVASLRRARDFAKIVATLSTFERDAIDAALRAREGEAS